MFAALKKVLPSGRAVTNYLYINESGVPEEIDGSPARDLGLLTPWELEKLNNGGIIEWGSGQAKKTLERINKEKGELKP